MKAKGRTVLMYKSPSQSIPMSHWSSGWMGTLWYALFTSTFAIRTPQPLATTAWTAVFTSAYDKEQIASLIPLLTVHPSGGDMSAIRRHFLEAPLGMTLKQLMCTWGNSPGRSGPKTRPWLHSIAS